MITQVGFGIYLKFGIQNSYVRAVAVTLHSVIGKVTPLVTWIQMGLGVLTLLDFCRGNHIYQVIRAHIGLTLLSASGTELLGVDSWPTVLY